MQCQNNLKQIGLGFHNYHDAQSILPYGQFGGFANNSALPAPPAPYTKASYTWSVTLLPYVEQQAAWDTLQTWATAQAALATSASVPTYNTANPAKDFKYKVYTCPSDP